VTVPVEIDFREPSVEPRLLVDLIRRKASGLERFAERLVRCRVSVEPPQREDPAEARARVRVQIRISPDHLAVSAAESSGASPEQGAQRAVHRAFRAIERQLREFEQEEE